MKFVFKALLMATALLPVATAASAQEGRPGRGGWSDRGARADRGPMQGGNPRGAQPARTNGGPDRPAEAQRNWTRGEPRQGGQDGRRDDRSSQVAVAPSPQGGGGIEAQGSRDWNRQRADAGRGDALRGNPRGDSADQRNWTSSRQVQQRDGRRFDNRGGFGQDWRNDGRNAQRYNDGGYNGGRYNNQGNWNRTWRNDNRYDWNRYRAGNRGAYRLPRYYAPQGWGYGYRRFSIGVTLSSLLWNESYWIGDPSAYRLPEAYGPYRWVRYYNDALLVDVRDGQVVDTVYGIFW